MYATTATAAEKRRLYTSTVYYNNLFDSNTTNATGLPYKLLERS
jgi:hypothetical protein